MSARAFALPNARLNITTSPCFSSEWRQSVLPCLRHGFRKAYRQDGPAGIAFDNHGAFIGYPDVPADGGMGHEGEGRIHGELQGRFPMGNAEVAERHPRARMVGDAGIVPLRADGSEGGDEMAALAVDL